MSGMQVLLNSSGMGAILLLSRYYKGKQLWTRLLVGLNRAILSLGPLGLLGKAWKAESPAIQGYGRVPV